MYCKLITNSLISTLILLIFMSNLPFKNAQSPPENDQPIVPLGRGPLPTHHLLPPARSVADLAQEYWISNECVYPPKTFYSMYRDACDVRPKAGTFLSGICQAYFNSSKVICDLDGASDDDKQTMIGIHDLQSTIGDDELCDTLADMKSTEPDIFPAKDERPKWFEMISSIIFTPETCSSACALRNAHPICFGYMLNYNYIESLKSRPAEKEEDKSEDESSQDSPSSSTDSEQGDKVTEVEEETKEEQTKESEEDDELNSNELNKEKDSDYYSDIIDSFEPAEVNVSFPFQPNPKLVGLKPSDPDYYYDFDDDMNFGSDENSDFSDGLGKNTGLLNDVIDVNDQLVEDKTLTETDVDYPMDSDFSVEDLPRLDSDFFNELSQKDPVQAHIISKPRLRSHAGKKMDRSDEIPLLSLLLAFSGLLAIMTFFVLVRSRKKIGSYMRHFRQRRRNNNWNYERVLTGQAEDNDY